MILWLLVGCYSDPTQTTDSGCGCPEDTGPSTGPDSGTWSPPSDSGEPTDTAAPPEPTELTTDAAVGVLQDDGGPGSRGAFVGPGDLDGDGFGELWVGVAGASTEDVLGAGVAWLVTGPVSGTLTSEETQTQVLGLSEGDQLGLQVGGGGDYDGDGQPDLWVSAPQVREGKGEVYLFSGSQLASGTLEPSDADAEVAGDGETGAWRSSGNGDVNGDGVDDLLVGSVRVKQGEATPWWLFYGPMRGRRTLADGDPVRSLQVTEADYVNPFQAGVVAELTGDGYAEVVLAEHTSTMSAGRLQVFEGSKKGLRGSVAMVVGATSQDHLGQDGALDVAGDVDGDGFVDLIVGAAAADDVRVDAGAAWLIYGPLSGVYSLAAHGERLTGYTTEEGAGTWVAGAGDVVGSGLADVLVGGASGSWLLSGPVVEGSLGLAERFLSDTSAYAAGVGDLDGDGQGDLAAVGAGQDGLWIYSGL